MVIKLRYVAFLLVILGGAAYSNSFYVPFIFDDFHVISENSGLRDLSNLREVFFSDSPGRPFLYLTFALNYAVGGYDTFGYHIVNFFLHICTSLLVFILLKEILARENIKKDIYPLAAAMVFILHPLNVEVVTYLSSRSTGLCTFFYLFSFWLAIKHPLGWNRTLFFSCCFFLLGMLTKELIASMPFLLAIYIFQFDGRERLKKSAPFLSVYWFLFLAVLVFRSFVKGYSLEKFSDLPFLTPLVYFKTELAVVAFGYLPRLFVPIHQIFGGNSNWKLFFLEPAVIGGLTVFVFLISASIYFFNSRKILSFSIIWFLVALSVTSSFIPIIDAYAERRVYPALPAFCLLIAYSLHELGYRFSKVKKALGLFIVLVLLVFSILTYQRNSLHTDPVLLWEDTISKASAKERVYANLAYQYIKRSKNKEAKETLLFGLKYNPDYVPMQILYCWLLGMESRFVEMEKVLKQIKPIEAKDASQVSNLYGVLAGEKGDFENSMTFFKNALKLNDANHDARGNVAALLSRMGKREEAILSLRASIKKYPLVADFHYHLGNYLLERSRSEALKEYFLALRLEPAHIGVISAMRKSFPNSLPAKSIYE